MTQVPSAPTPVERTADTVVSWIAVAATPAVFAGAFVLGTALIGDPNVPTAATGWDAAWRVLVLWFAVEIVPTVGVVFGVRAARRREPAGRSALVANVLVFLFFTAVTLAAGLIDLLG